VHIKLNEKPENSLSPPSFRREFRVELREDPSSVFASDIIIENSDGPIDYDLSRVYTGKLEGELKDSRAAPLISRKEKLIARCLSCETLRVVFSEDELTKNIRRWDEKRVFSGGDDDGKGEK
jgi:hypothetical protein